ncbi:MAG: hypothetical protein OXR62_13600 [Ahrensia sp.]|nr:hypothetical protein [Ahrensia sp.]
MDKIAIEIRFTSAAEYDAALLGISDANMRSVCNSFLRLPYSDDDEVVGPLLIRSFGEFDFVFDLGRNDAAFAITVVRIKPRGAANSLSRLKRLLSSIAMLRSALGL